MCAMSLVMQYGLDQPRVNWQQPAFPETFVDLLIKAKQFDDATGQPDCELDDKRPRETMISFVSGNISASKVCAISATPGE